MILYDNLENVVLYCYSFTRKSSVPYLVNSTFLLQITVLGLVCGLRTGIVTSGTYGAGRATRTEISRSRVQSTVGFPIGDHVNVLSDY